MKERLVLVLTVHISTCDQSDKDTRADIAKVFELYDDDNTGKISLRNMKRVAKELGETMNGEFLSADSQLYGPEIMFIFHTSLVPFR